MEENDPIEEEAPEVEEDDQSGSGSENAVEVEEEGTTPAATEEPKWNRVRNDLYRRQSHLEGQLSHLTGLVEGLARAKGNSNGASPPPVHNPIQDRLKFQQDPLGAIEEIVERKTREQEDRVARKVSETTQEQSVKQEFYGNYPEMKDTAHPFYQEANARYLELCQNGHPEGYKTAMVAARLAAAESPHLREKSLRDRRRSVSDRTTSEAIASRGKVDIGAPKPKSKPEAAKITDQDLEIARAWKVDLSDKKTQEWIRSEKAKLQAQRYETRRDED